MNFQRIAAVVLRHIYVWPRGLERFMWSVGWPLVDLLIWGITTSYLQQNSMMTISLTTLILGGIIFWGITSRSQLEITISFLDEMWNKNLINIFSTPLTIVEFLTATVILGIIKFFFSVIFLTLFAFIFYKFNIFIYGWHMPFLLANLILFGWTFGFFVTALIMYFGRSIEELTWSLIYFLQPFSCVFYPLSSLPSWAQLIGRILPTTYIFEEMRRYLSTGTMIWENLMSSFILNVIYLILALIFLSLIFEKVRETGRLTKLEG